MKELLFFLSFLIFLSGCKHEKVLKLPLKYPNLKFAVASDIHFYDTELGTTGSAFQNYIDSDSKLLAENQEITDSLSEKIIYSDAQFFIISGDLTKDGEKSSHLKFAKQLEKIEISGKQVYIINGNHDILNPEAVSFSGDKTTPCPNITPQEFSDIYSHFGYSDAVMKDSTSLSYVAEPVQGVWLLMIDSCNYDSKNRLSIIKGEVTKDTFKWIKEVIKKASIENKSVICVMHHGVINHYPNNIKHYPDYVIKNSSEVSNFFISSGVNVVFTGHYHAQDATVKSNKSGFILDIETGSPLTYPCPYRIIELNDNILTSSSFFIDKIASNPDFKKYSENFNYNGSAILTTNVLTKYGANKKDSALLVPQVTTAYTCHLKGDEIKPDKYLNLKGVRLLPYFIIQFKKGLIKDWYSDLPPSDNNFKFDLNTGKEIK